MAIRPSIRPDRSGSFAYVAVVYVLAVAAAWAVWQWGGLNPEFGLFVGLYASCAVTYAAILHADNGSVFDAWWSVLPPFVALWCTGLSDAESLTPRQLAVHTVVWFWAVRLTLNWARGWPGLEHEDWRYVDLAEKWPLPRWAVRLVAVVVAPTTFVALGCLPLFPVLASADAGFGVLDGLALIVGVGAVSIEALADEQMWSFARTKQPGEIMNHGLWKLSRHPNYFGEIGFWVSLWLFALAAGAWWTGIGALAMIGLFQFASIPLLDERSIERRPGYAAYAARTPALIPWPRSGDPSR